ncbi:MAG: dihydropteroate synthase [Acidobacteria bacterium]|nr:dihydropteroate synthase [Acidobacteriota bacterium]
MAKCLKIIEKRNKRGLAAKSRKIAVGVGQAGRRNGVKAWEGGKGFLIKMETRDAFELDMMGKKVRLGLRTFVMGVLNTTPDSFSDGGLYMDSGAAVAHGVEMVRQGADWIDVGGESTRPGSRPISAEEEAERVLPVIRGLRRKLGAVPISIDTTKASVAAQAVRAGANIVNDISGLRFDERLAEVAARYHLPLILMHIRGRPENMQQRPFVRSIWRSVHDGLEWSVKRALARGVRREQLIIDPGLGFGKSRTQNYEILGHLGRLRSFRLPILVGTSRKSFVRAATQGEKISGAARRKRPALANPSAKPGSEVLSSLEFADAAAVTAAILNGAHIVRVHDVEHMVPAVRLADAIVKATSGGR